MLLPIRHARRLAATLAPLVALASIAHPAAADEKEACVAASDQGQNLRDEGKLRRAREAFATCARDVCPGIVRKDCEKWLGDVDASFPTLVIAARDANGRDVLGARILVDGALLSDHLDGKPLAVEPGEHHFRYDAPGMQPYDERIVVRLGEKNRVITVLLKPQASAAPKPKAAPPAEPPPDEPAPAAAHVSDAPKPESGGAPALVYVLGGVGVAALGSFAYFGITGRSDLDDLRATCAPTCAASDVDAAKTKLLVADVSLGVSVVSLVAATWIFVASDASPPAKASSARVDVRPAPGGASLVVRGTF